MTSIWPSHRWTISDDLTLFVALDKLIPATYNCPVGVMTVTNEEKILEILANMKDDISDMKDDISDVKEEISDMKEEISDMKEEISDIKGTLAEHGAILAEHSMLLSALIDWADECREADKLPLPKLM